MATNEFKLLPISLLAVAFLCGPAARSQSRDGLLVPPPSDQGIRLKLSDEIEDGRERAGTSADPAGASAPGPAGEDADEDRKRLALRGVALKIALSETFEDNVLRTDKNERGDFITRVAPTFGIDLGYGKHKFGLSYSGEYAGYRFERNENYFDHELTANGVIDVTRRLDINLNSALEFDHDPRGDVDSRLIQSEQPDRWRKHSASAEIVYGRKITRGQVKFKTEVDGTRYFNNSQSSRDIDRRTFSLDGRWRVRSRLSVVGTATNVYTSHLDPTTRLDSRETSLLVGVAWEATAKTTGEIKVGRFIKNYNDPGVSSESGNDWDMTVTWEPKTFSKWTAFARRNVSESADQGADSGVSDMWGVRWVHGFSKRLQLESKATYTKSAFGIAREDLSVDLSTEVVFQMRPWLTLRAMYALQDKESETSEAEFENHTLMFKMESDFGRRMGGKVP